jgi:hypothetical protein
MQIAISGHWSQSIGADLSGQHGMSADISTVAVGAALAAFAGAESGASTSPAIKRIASSRPTWVKMFTSVISHIPAAMETSAVITKSPEAATSALIWLNGQSFPKGNTPPLTNQSLRRANTFNVVIDGP